MEGNSMRPRICEVLPNERATGKGGIPFLLTIGRARPALPEHERWAPLNIMRTSFIILLLAGLLVGCEKAPSDVEVFTKTTEALDSYLHTNALGAEAVMLQLERATHAWEKAGYRGRGPGAMPLDQAYASLYSRLYLVEKALGKKEAADGYYRLAAEYWRKANAADPRPRAAGEQISDQIEGVNRYFGAAQWQTEK